ncbi:MAG: hypothetical protein ACRENT_08335 [Thermodesulfobacteriota bacterium]
MEKDKVSKDTFEGSWASLLSNIYGISRSEFDQREKKSMPSYSLICVD